MGSMRKIALAGNPNVGKSTVFNGLTGLRQHTGNWPGKTVGLAEGICRLGEEAFVLLDVPGAYSLCAQSAEEEAAMEALCFMKSDAVIAVCDACCLERNLNLVYQIMEVTDHLVVCVNLMDEAKKRGVFVDGEKLARLLGTPVVCAAAREGKGLEETLKKAREVMVFPAAPRRAALPPAMEEAVNSLASLIAPHLPPFLSPRCAALRLLEDDPAFQRELSRRCDGIKNLLSAAEKARNSLSMTSREISLAVTNSIYRAAEAACALAVSRKEKKEQAQLKADRALTGPWGIPVMLLLLALIFFLTIQGANWPSMWLEKGFAELEVYIRQGLAALGTPPFWLSLLADGVYGTMARVISVMLPPMAIFFPLFTLLEDSGYLPRAAFLLDSAFQRCQACGKQALTMCMGFGCNAAGVIGCRIIDSPRERLIAILTNSLVPCNGRFPTLFALLTLFFGGGGLWGAAKSALLLLLLLALSVGMTFLCSYLLSKTVLRGVPSSFTLELPPYRRPQLGKVLVRSVLDRTLFVLGRAAAVAAPAGLIIFLLSNLRVNGAPLLSHITGFLDPLGRLMGLDGVLLSAFLLGFPANEIVLPIAVMAYSSASSMGQISDLSALGNFLRYQGFTPLTALNVMLFSLFHFPCSTTLLTIRKETGSGKWTLLSALLPTAVGMALCMLTNLISKIL